MQDLTPEEAAWVKRLQKLLKACPSDRIGAFTIGDADITLYDRNKEKEVFRALEGHNVDFCQAVDKVDAMLGKVVFPFQIHSTSG